MISDCFPSGHLGVISRNSSEWSFRSIWNFTSKATQRIWMHDILLSNLALGFVWISAVSYVFLAAGLSPSISHTHFHSLAWPNTDTLALLWDPISKFQIYFTLRYSIETTASLFGSTSKGFANKASNKSNAIKWNETIWLSFCKVKPNRGEMHSNRCMCTCTRDFTLKFSFHHICCFRTFSKGASQIQHSSPEK